MREQCALGEAPSLTHAQMNHRNVHTEERLLATQPRIHARTQARTTPCASSTAKAWANTQARKHARTRRTRPAAHASARIDRPARRRSRRASPHGARASRSRAPPQAAAGCTRRAHYEDDDGPTAYEHGEEACWSPASSTPSPFLGTNTHARGERPSFAQHENICALIWPSLRKDRSVLCVQHGLGGEVGGLACVGVCSLRAQRTARMECKKEQ